MGNASRAAQPDEADIHRTLELFHPLGEVFEIRTVGSELSRDLYGFFNNHKNAVDAALQCVRGDAEGVYVTLNPVNPDLLTRAKNRLRKTQKGVATKDEDV